MSQHYLLSAKARTLSLSAVLRMSDDEAFETFKRIRWESNGGDPFCPNCGCVKVYVLAETPIRWKCAGCRRKFSVTSGTLFASRKLPIRDYLAAIALFCNGAKGLSSLQLSRDLDIHAKSAFVLLHKLREAMGSDVHGGDDAKGSVEIDGAYFGGHVKPANEKADRKDRRLQETKTGKRQVVVVIRERHGKALPFVFGKEGDAVPTVKAKVDPSAILYADENREWDKLHASYDTRRINHSVEYARDDVSTNWAESYFSRLRRAEIGQHHHISGAYLYAYADEMAWRENNRRTSTGEQWARVIGAALTHPKSRVWAGYWQRCAA
jgi:transposase-like protein